MVGWQRTPPDRMMDDQSFSGFGILLFVKNPTKPLHGEAAQAPLGLVASDKTARVTTRLGLARVLA